MNKRYYKTLQKIKRNHFVMLSVEHRTWESGKAHNLQQIPVYHGHVIPNPADLDIYQLLPVEDLKKAEEIMQGPKRDEYGHLLSWPELETAERIVNVYSLLGYSGELGRMVFNLIEDYPILKARIENYLIKRMNMPLKTILINIETDYDDWFNQDEDTTPEPYPYSLYQELRKLT